MNTRLIPPPSSIQLPTSETTIAGLLKRAGYATAHFGKWHVGRTDPSRYGFDASDGPTNNGGPDNVDNPYPKELYGMTERGIEFMTRQVKGGRPFSCRCRTTPREWRRRTAGNPRHREKLGGRPE